MTRDQETGKLNFQWKDLAGVFTAMLVAATVPVVGAMVVMYGDVREIKTNIGTLKDNDHDQRVTLRDHDQRISKLEQSSVEQ